MSDIKEKIKNLFDLASSDNEHEAKAALLKAQELMVKHKLTEKDLDLVKKQEVKVINTGFKYSTIRDSYILSLTDVLTNNYCCVHYASKGYRKKIREMVIAGLEDDVDICMQVLQKAVQTIKANENKLVYRQGFSEHKKKVIKKSYEEGFVIGLKELFDKQRKANEDDWGLVLVIPEDVQNIISDMQHCSFRTKGYAMNSTAYNKGISDGKEFNPEKTHGVGASTLAITG